MLPRTVLALVALSFAPWVSAQPAEPAWHAEVDRAVSVAMRAPIEGVAVTVLQGDRVLLDRAYGLADVETEEVVGAESVFEIGSITKMFTAAAILILAEEGRLSLDDAVGDYLPELGARGAEITLRHLLTHTSGLSSDWAVADPTAPAAPRAVLDTLAARPPEFVPGARYAYTNNGYILLGYVVERVTGQPYPEVVRARLVEPLGLASVAPCASFPASRRVLGVEHATRGPITATPADGHDPTVTFSAGMLCATAGDLARWSRALTAGRVVRFETYARMAAPTVLPSGREAPYGLGLQRYEWEGRPAVGHDGATPGFVSEVVHVPGDSLTVVVLTNGVYAGQIVQALAFDILRAAARLPIAEAADRPTTAEERALYVGTYDLGGMPIEVYEQGDHLRVLPPGQVAARLLSQGDGVFRAEHDPSLQVRFLVGDGGAQDLVIQQGERSLPPARRLP